MNGASINTKIARRLLKELSKNIEVKLTTIKELELETIVAHDGQACFDFFCNRTMFEET